MFEGKYQFQEHPVQNFQDAVSLNDMNYLINSQLSREDNQYHLTIIINQIIDDFKI